MTLNINLLLREISGTPDHANTIFIQIEAHFPIAASPSTSSNSWLRKMGEIDFFCIKKALNWSFISYIYISTLDLNISVMNCSGITNYSVSFPTVYCRSDFEPLLCSDLMACSHPAAYYLNEYGMARDGGHGGSLN